MSCGLLIGQAYEPPDNPRPAVARPAPVVGPWGRDFQVMVYVEAVKRNADLNGLRLGEAPRPDDTPGGLERGQASLHDREVTSDDGSASEDLRLAFLEAFGDRWEFAWGVAACESVNFRHDVVYGPTTGGAGELGIYQLHPRGVLPAFLDAGYDDPFNPYQQIEFVAAYTAVNGFGAWACAQ